MSRLFLTGLILQIDFNNGPAGSNLFWRPLSNLTTMMEHDDPIASVHDGLHDMSIMKMVIPFFRIFVMSSIA